MLENLSLAVERMNTLTIERYYRRNRFWYWLFGTDDWLARELAVAIGAHRARARGAEGSSRAPEPDRFSGLSALHALDGVLQRLEKAGAVLAREAGVVAFAFTGLAQMGRQVSHGAAPCRCRRR